MKLLRATAVEQALWSAEFGEMPTGNTPAQKMAAGFLKGTDIAGAIAKLQRYETTARRMYHQAEAAFRRQHSYTLESLVADRQKAASELGELGVVAMEAIAFLRLREFKNLTLTSHLSEGVLASGTNSNPVQSTPETA